MNGYPHTKINHREFLVENPKTFTLAKRPTKIKDVYTDGSEANHWLAQIKEEIGKRQELLYASRTYSLLLIFQGMDTAGKDGTIKHVLSGVNPQGCHVATFKAPESRELSHDFLWRTHQEMPARGEIGVFNRSYYEEVVAVRVHPQFLEKQNLPPENRHLNKIFKERLLDIANHESYLSRQGIRIIKFYLHLSPEEQRRRLQERITNPSKSWKFNPADLNERKHFKKYLSAYEEAMRATSTKDNPWYVIPADDKKNTRLIVSQIVVDRLDQLKLQYPKTKIAKSTTLKI